jgi:hypothetical protein
MCSPKIHLADHQLKRRKYFKDVKLNDPASLLKRGVYKNFERDQMSEAYTLKKTEFHFINVVLFRGVQTYFCNLKVDDLEFKKFGSDAKELARYLDKALMDKGYTQANGTFKPK